MHFIYAQAVLVLELVAVVIQPIVVILICMVA